MEPTSASVEEAGPHAPFHGDATCEHVFVGAAGSPYAAFRRALDAGNLTRALTEARELPQVSPADALALLLLIAEQPRNAMNARQLDGRLCLSTPLAQ